jgi:dipeptidyl-peptidase-4
MRYYLSLLSALMIVFLTQVSSIAQENQKTISLDDIWSSRVFAPEMVFGINPMNDGKTYAVIENQSIAVYDYATGNLLHTLVEFSKLVPENGNKPISVRSYQFSSDETKLLIPTETESIYRHSTRSNYYVYDLKTEKLIPLSAQGKQQLASFSPDGNKIAFVRENNLFVKDLILDQEQQITTDGKINEIINGTTDWVYEEEFSFTKAYFWSPDSKKIAFIRFDESDVKEFQMAYYNGLYPEQYVYKYPKAGEDNSIVSVHIWNADNNNLTTVDIGSETDIYIPRIMWTTNPKLLAVQRMNRHQNHLEILLANATDGKTHLLYEEKNKYFIDITDDLTFLPDGKQFIISSEKDGYNHLYLHDMSGKQIRQLTKGPFDVTQFYGYSAKNKKIYYQSAEPGPTEKTIHTVDLKGKKETLISRKGQNNASFSKDFSFFINTNTTINSPHLISVHRSNGNELRVLKNNEKLKDTMKEYNWSEVKFFTISHPDITLPDGTPIDLNAWKILPPSFDAEKQYPVLLYIYGGPGSQTVNNAWGGANQWWFQMLAQQGIIVVSVDNRGTGARGETFKKMTYLELGKYETEDLISTAKYLAELPYVDKNKIGVFGWSYGGYMSSLAITKGADHFQCAIAVAPVTNWRYYDNIYTERYMRRPSENSSGYDDNSPINHVDKLKGSYLLVHGSADDNVHYQNAMEMINALSEANIQFELMIYPNRNHGISGGKTRLHLYRLMTDFLKRNLLN